MSDQRASTLVDQANEEARHQGAASLTAVRIWPTLSGFVDVNDEVARRRFIVLLTRYKVLVHEEARRRTRATTHQFRRFTGALRDKRDQEAEEVFNQAVELGQSDLSVAREFDMVLRTHPAVPRSAILGSYDRNSLQVAARILAKRILVSTKANNRGHPRRAARDKALKALSLYLQRHNKFRARSTIPKSEVDLAFAFDRNGDATTFLIDFLMCVNAGLLKERESSNLASNPTLRLPHNLPFTGKDEHDPRKKIRETLRSARRKMYI